MDNNATINELEQLKSSLLAKISAIDEIISMFKSKEATLDSKSNTSANEVFSGKSRVFSGYNKKVSFKQKLALIVKNEQRFLSLKEITDIAFANEPTASYDDLKKGLASAKSALIKEGALFKYAVGPSHQNSFYGSKNWIAEDGSIKPAFVYDEKQLNTRQEIEI